MQKLFLFIGKPLEKLAGRVSDRTKNILLVISVFLMSAQYFLRASGLADRFLKTVALPSVVRTLFFDALGCLIMLLFAFASIRGPLRPVKWNKLMAASWYLLCLFIWVAGIVTSVDYLPIAVILTFVFPYVIFIWNNRGDYDTLFLCLCRGILWFFALFALGSICLTPITQAQYCGLFINSNSLGQYMVVVIVACLFLYHRASVEKWRFSKVWPSLLAFGTACAFLILSQSRTALLSVVAAVLVWLVMTALSLKGKRWLLHLCKAVASFAVAALVCLPAVFWSITTVTGLVGANLNMWALDMELSAQSQAQEQNLTSAESELRQAPTEEEAATPPESQPQEEQPATAPEKDNTTLGGILDSLGNRLDTEGKDANQLSTYRLDVWRAYAKELNWLGNQRTPIYINEILGTKGTAHNTYLQVGYEMGVVAMALYLVFNLVAGVCAIRFGWRTRRQSPFAMLPLVAAVAFGVTSLLESVFYPFGYLIAFVYWLSQAPLFEARLKAEPAAPCSEKAEGEA